MSSAFSILDLETGGFLEGDPDEALAARGSGDAWQPASDPDVWHLRSDRDPRGTPYRSVRVFGPGGDSNWYEDTVENLDTSESA
jgi:hypothetical protein